MEEDLAETEVDAEVTEALNDDVWPREAVKVLEIEATAVDKVSLVKSIDDAAGEAVALTITCVCL